MKAVLEMNREELIALRPEEVTGHLNADEVVHMARVLGAFWSYDYVAAKQGKVGMHALLKSGRHSDGFFVSKILLEPVNVRQIMAKQMVMQLGKAGIFHTNYVIGIPDGATLLGQEVSKILETKCGIMEKDDGRLRLVTEIEPGALVLFIEDFCTRGTGFKEAVKVVLDAQPEAVIFPVDPVILNRGGLITIVVEADSRAYRVVAGVERRVQDWAADETEPCPLCAIGSLPIKPKVKDENWQTLINSQK